jgi:predicted phage-related endonuclease
MSEGAVCLPRAGGVVSHRRAFIGGSDARIVMGTDEVERLWREKRGEAEPPDYSDNLVVQLGGGRRSR